MIIDAMDADQLDCGKGKEGDQPSYGKEDGLIKVKYEILLLIKNIQPKLEHWPVNVQETHFVRLLIFVLNEF